MPLTALVLTIAVYAALVVLLLSLNIFSLWRWWVKAGTIIVTTLCIVIAYFSISGMIGWPTNAALPDRFHLIATRIIEPNKLTGTPGHIYLWVERINENSVPTGAPRGYQVPYEPKLADDTADAQEQINSGKQIMGQKAGGGEQGTAPETDGEKAGGPSGRMGGKTGGGSQPTGISAAAETIGEATHITFSDMPPAQLPDKAAIIIPPDE